MLAVNTVVINVAILSRLVLTRLEEGVNKTNERVMRFELTTLCLGSTYSTAELHPQARFNYRQQDKILSTRRTQILLHQSRVCA